jgi:hypothetical protein
MAGQQHPVHCGALVALAASRSAAVWCKQQHGARVQWGCCTAAAAPCMRTPHCRSMLSLLHLRAAPRSARRRDSSSSPLQAALAAAVWSQILMGISIMQRPVHGPRNQKVALLQR